MNTTNVLLEDTMEILSGFAFNANLFNTKKIGLPIIRVRDVNSGFSNNYYNGDFCDKYLINNGDLLISMDGDFKIIKWNSGKALLNQRVCKLIPNLKFLDANYLYRYLPLKLQEIHSITSFATVKHLSTKDILKIQIPLPPLPIQKKIADVLDKADSLRQKRKEAIAKLDELCQSLFLDMFGDPVTNPKRWEVKRLEELSEIVSGVTKGKVYNNTTLIDLPYLRVANVQDGHLVLDEIKFIKVSQNEKNNYLLKPGDILFTEGGDPDKLGRGAVWRGEIENCIHQNHIFRVRIMNEKIITPIYLNKLAGSIYGKRYFLKSAKQTTGIASINSKQLRRFECYLPPIQLQHQFAARIEKIQALKEQHQKSLAELDNLFNSLMQRAFKGELEFAE